MNRNITAIILVAIAIGIYFTYTQGQIDHDNTIVAVNGQYQNAINNARSLEAIRDSVQEDFKQISPDDQAKLDKILPSSVNNIHLIVDVSKMANSNGFALRNIKADVVQNTAQSNAANTISPVPGMSGSSLIPTTSLANVKLSFDTTAPYYKFESFMQQLEKSLRIMDVTKLTLKATDTGVYDFSVEINTYWLKQ